MLLIYCADPLHPRQPDSDYQEEITAAEAVGLAHALISYEALVDDGDAEVSVRRIAPQSPPVTGIYRGWMLRPAQYTCSTMRCWREASFFSTILLPIATATIYQMVSAVRGPYARSSWLEGGANCRWTRYSGRCSPLAHSPSCSKTS